jgi:hypothetical protein
MEKEAGSMALRCMAWAWTSGMAIAAVVEMVEEHRR